MASLYTTVAITVVAEVQIGTPQAILGNQIIGQVITTIDTTITAGKPR